MKIDSAIYKEGDRFYVDFNDESLQIPEASWENGDSVLFQYEGIRYRGTIEEIHPRSGVFLISELKKLA